MGTAKRERQKANRALKLEQQAKQERVQKVKRTSARWLLYAGGLVLVVLALLWASGAFNGGDDDTSADSSNSTATAASTLPVSVPVSYPAIDKPEVSLPDPIPTELSVTELKPGEGPKAAVGDTVTLYYVGVLSTDGTEFDSSYDPPRTFDVTIGVTGVIQGWTEGLVGVQQGGQYQLDIPSDLAYGADGRPPTIEPDTPLTFVVDILNVQPAG